MSNQFDHDAALEFDLFAGDFGDSDDVELSNKIVTGRGEYTCFICYGKIVKGEVHRSAVHKFDGEIMSYRVCYECCKAMASSVNYDFMNDDEGVEYEQDPIDARYALGHERREQYRNEALSYLNIDATIDEIDEEIQNELEAWND